MLKELLVCLEGSLTTQRAIELAIKIAQDLPCSLIGLAIVDEPTIRAGAATGVQGSSYKQERDESLVHDAEAHAHDWVGKFMEAAKAAGVTASPMELRGKPADMILGEGARHDLTMIGRHTNFVYETQEEDKHTLGQVLYGARKPLIIVPEEPFRPGTPVMIGYDGSSAANRAVQSFAESGLARLCGPLHVVTVDDDGVRAHERAQKAVEILAALGLKAAPHGVVSALPIAEALLKERARWGAGLFVSGAYRPARLVEMVWGSVTSTLIEKMPVPLYLHS